MEVTVIKPLNVRVGSPSVNAPCYQYLAPGSVLEVDGQLYNGDPYDDINTWFKDLANNYYWSGGVVYDAEAAANVFIPEKMSWGHKWYDIPFIWNDLKTKGKGVTVAVIDTGVDSSHIDLALKINKSSRSFIGQANVLNDIDGHGTTMAGIIGAAGNKVFGVAPEVSLLILKATDNVRGADPDLFSQALEHAASLPEVDIISFSNVFQDTSKLKTSIEKCIASKKIVLASIGNSRDFIGSPNGPDTDTFPACYNDVVAIGSFDEKGDISSFSNWNAHLSFLAPGDFSIRTTGLNNSVVMGSGTSIATAFSAGCLALMLSYAKTKSIKPEKCIQALLDTCDDFGGTIGKDIQSGFGRMNFRNAVNRIKNL